MNNLIQFIKNVLAVRVYTVGMLRLLWRFRWIVIYRSGSDSSWIHIDLLGPRVRSIEIGRCFSRPRLVGSLVHELGHALDLYKRPLLYFRYRSDKEVRRELEVRAWEYAIELTQEYNLVIDVEDAKESLASYGARSAVLEGMREEV